jgi:PAS domain S-box-containing protein
MKRQSLLFQILLAFVGLVLLTALLVGLPALWLIRQQQTRQAWAQVDQGSQAMRALYAARQSEMVGLATLTAGRPTLHSLLAQTNPEALAAYLRTLQTEAGVDAVMICNSQGQMVGQSGGGLPAQLCVSGEAAGFYPLSDERATAIWLLAARTIAATGADRGLAIVGEQMDEGFAQMMHTQTGLEHTLFVNDQQATSSAAGSLSIAGRQTAAPAADGSRRTTFTWGTESYYAARLPLSGLLPAYDPATTTAPEVEIALAVTDMVYTQQRLARTLVASILAATLIGSILGAFLARRINRPLARLADAAATLGGGGSLDTSLAEEIRVRELAQVAQALEHSGRDLQRTLTDLRREKAWSEHLIEAIIEGIITLDQAGRIVFFSAGAERITGWGKAEVVGRSCDQVFRPAEGGELFSQLLPAPGLRQKITVLLAAGRPATVDVTGARLLPPEAGKARLALVFRDVSEEEAIHRLVGHFLANVTHEFRTPLSALAASSELLRDQAPDLNPAELQELLSSLHLGILGLQTLVDNLLEGASIEVGRFHVYPRPADLGRIVGEAVAMTRPLLEKRGQRIEVQMPEALPMVQADSRRSQQALVNLLSNAGKYGPDGAVVEVSVAVEPQRVRVSVADRGPGLPPELWQELFQRFHRRDPNTAEAQYGVGLGLSVVKAVIEAHGGEVGAENRPGGGAVFWFTLPLASAEPAVV